MSVHSPQFIILLSKNQAIIEMTDRLMYRARSAKDNTEEVGEEYDPQDVSHSVKQYIQSN